MDDKWLHDHRAGAGVEKLAFDSIALCRPALHCKGSVENLEDGIVVETGILGVLLLHKKAELIEQPRKRSVVGDGEGYDLRTSSARARAASRDPCVLLLLGIRVVSVGENFPAVFLSEVVVCVSKHDP